MANVKHGLLTRPQQWWRHLKQEKRFFWHRERQAARKFIEEQKNAEPEVWTPLNDWEDDLL